MRTSRPCRWEKSGPLHLELPRVVGSFKPSQHTLAVGRQSWMMRWMGCTLQFLTCGMSRQVALLQGSSARLLLLFFNSFCNSSNINYDLEAMWHILVSQKLWLMTDQHGEPCTTSLPCCQYRPDDEEDVEGTLLELDGWGQDARWLYFGIWMKIRRGL